MAHDALAHEHAGHAHHASPGFVQKYLWSTDHKMIGMHYMFTGMLMALIGGFTVYVFRMQLAFPGIAVPFFGRVSADDSNTQRRSFIANFGLTYLDYDRFATLLAGGTVTRMVPSSAAIAEPTRARMITAAQIGPSSRQKVTLINPPSVLSAP